MTNPTTVTTRPDAHPAKNVRRAGAPNTQQSGETPMVGNNRDLHPGSNGPLTPQGGGSDA